MILKADQIAGLLGEKDNPVDPLVIVPEPPLDDLRNSGAASVDLRLGTWFVTLRQSKIAGLGVYDSTSSKPSETQLTRKHYVPFGRDFVLHPHNFVLGVTLEWIRLPRKLAGYVVGKSSWGRRGLIIATAVAVHPGFVGCLTLELTNVGEIPISIKPGMKICQLCLHEARSTSDQADKSRFIGFRKPTLGVVQPDEMARILGRGQTP